MPNDKRQRHKEGRQARREAAIAEARRQQRRRRIIQVVGGAAAVVVLALLVTALSNNDGDKTDVASDSGSTTTTEASGTTDAPADTPPVCAPGAEEQDMSKKPAVQVPESDPPSELVCMDLKEGTGDEAALGDTIEVQYVGVKYSDGSQFDSSWDNGGKPVSFQLAEGSLIKGWTDGIPGMKVGGRRELIIPPELAYGPKGSGHELAGETLVFVVDLVSVTKG